MASYGGELLLDSSSLEVASPIIFLPSPFHYHSSSRSKGFNEEDPRPISSTWSYITPFSFSRKFSSSSFPSMLPS